MNPINNAFIGQLLIAEAGLTWPRVDRVLLVGGSSRMPMVRDMLRQLTGKEPDPCLDPDLAVARGAAIFARSEALKQGVRFRAAAETVAHSFQQLRHRSVNSHSLGIEVTAEGIETPEQLDVLAVRAARRPAQGRGRDA